MTILSHALRSIEAAPLDVVPWPHLEISGFLPWDFYARLLADWPTEGWEELVYPDQKKPDGHYRRKQLDLTKSELLPELTNAMTSPAFKEAMFRRLKLDGATKAFAFPMLIDDEPGYWIRLHPDTPAKIVTFQVYLPEDESTLEMGTELVGNGAMVLLQFWPNSGFAFHPTAITNHQVREGQCMHRRRSIQVTFYNNQNPNVAYLK